MINKDILKTMGIKNKTRALRKVTELKEYNGDLKCFNSELIELLTLDQGDKTKPLHLAEKLPAVQWSRLGGYCPILYVIGFLKTLQYQQERL